MMVKAQKEGTTKFFRSTERETSLTAEKEEKGLGKVPGEGQ